MAEYQYMRLSLIEQSIPLMENAKVAGNIKKRPDYIKDLMIKEEPQTFFYKDKDMCYVFAYNEDDILCGIVGRRISKVIKSGPEDKFAPIDEKEWKTANVFVHLNEPYLQIIAMEKNKDVGAPKGILESLLKQLEKDKKLYDLSLNYIIEQDEFWSVINNNAHNITNIKYEFVAPNMFGGRDAFNEKLKNLRDKDNMQKIAVQITSDKKPLKIESEENKQMAELALDGCGSVEVKDGRNIIFTSKKNNKIKKVKDNVTVSENSKVPIRNILKEIFK